MIVWKNCSCGSLNDDLCERGLFIYIKHFLISVREGYLYISNIFSSL